MTDETLAASTTVAAPPEAVFAVLADPTSHAAIDGTGWVTDALDTAPLAGRGQTFRMAMYHEKHPDGRYRVANRVTVFDPPRAIAWEPGPDVEGDGERRPGGWVWRYDLAPDPAGTNVTLTYDWSGATPQAREIIAFPPFPKEHLVDSVRHLAELVVGS